MNVTDAEIKKLFSNVYCLCEPNIYEIVSLAYFKGANEKKMLGSYVANSSFVDPNMAIRDLVKGVKNVVFLSFGAVTFQYCRNVYIKVIDVCLDNLLTPVVCINATEPELREFRELYQEKKVYIGAYFDYKFWMKRAFINIHHGGAGATNLALEANKPMIIISFNAD